MRLSSLDKKYLHNQNYLEFYKKTCAYKVDQSNSDFLTQFDLKSLPAIIDQIDQAIDSLSQLIEIVTDCWYRVTADVSTEEVIDKTYSELYSRVDQELSRVRNALPPFISQILEQEDKSLDEFLKSLSPHQYLAEKVGPPTNARAECIKGYIHWLVLIQKDLQGLADL